MPLVELHRQEGDSGRHLTLSQAARLAGLSAEELIELLGEEEVPAVDYPADEIAEELDAAR